MIEVKSLFMSPPPPVARSRRAKQIARSFGLKLPDQTAPKVRAPVPDPLSLASLVPAPGEIVLITGASGAGKSSLLRAIRAITAGAVRWIDLDRLQPAPHRAVVDVFGRRMSIPRVLELLSRVGLAEVWTYLRKPCELSEGQRWRLKLALALSRAKGSRRCSPRPVIVCDEFAALLDRVTAAIVARTLRRAIDQDRAQSALVATSHEDLVRALKPDVFVRCDFGRVQIERSRSSPRRGEAR
jgi:ABC-type ATPase with predicted acetyltransferase domain